MKLSAPTQMIFLISVVVAIIAVLMALGVISFIPVAAVWIMALAYVILAAGCLLKGV